jgi:hypothetical protein
MLEEIEKNRDFHFVKKCKLSNEGCRILLSVIRALRAFKAPAARSKPLRGVQGAFGAFKVQGRCAALFVICYQLFGFPLFPITINC